MNKLHIEALATRVFRTRENLTQFISESVPKHLVREKMVLAITSKIVSLAEGRLVSPATIDKTTLVKREADHFLGEIGYGCFLTIKNGLLIPSAGIDESNSENGDFILYPSDPTRSAAELWRSLRQIWQINDLGILLTDSHTSPLRRGVTGVCLSYFGFRPVKNMVGENDLFGRKLRMTQMNLVDGLSAAAVLLMGEGRETRPLAVIHGADLEFSKTHDPTELTMPLAEDLYSPLLKDRL